MEILGIYKNQWGPKQDVILAKLGGKGQRTNVAAGMSGSPVYIDGKLVGAIALRFSTFSPDALCGITPIELMLEVNEFDDSRPSNARTPGKRRHAQRGLRGIVFALRFAGCIQPVLRTWFPSRRRSISRDSPKMFCPSSRPQFQQMGMTVAGGGGASTMTSPKPAPGWQTFAAAGRCRERRSGHRRHEHQRHVHGHL